MKKLHSIIFSFILSVGIFLGTSATVHAAPVLMADGNFFDAQYYAQNNPDVAAVFGTDASMLYAHYVNNGMLEGRMPYDPTIDISSIMDLTAYIAAVDATLRETDSSYLDLMVSFTVMHIVHILGSHIPLLGKLAVSVPGLTAPSFPLLLHQVNWQESVLLS